jgi:hypothetical protein
MAFEAACVVELPFFLSLYFIPEGTGKGETVHLVSFATRLGRWAV